MLVILFRLFITIKGKAERRGVFRPKGLFASFSARLQNRAVETY